MREKDGQERTGSAKADERREREAAALRDNLKRRKAQTRGRTEGPPEPGTEPTPEPEPGDSSGDS